MFRAGTPETRVASCPYSEWVGFLHELTTATL